MSEPTREEIAMTIDDRFRRWGAFLRANGALPAVVVGLVLDGNTPVVATCEGVEDELIASLLEVAASALRAGAAECR